MKTIWKKFIMGTMMTTALAVSANFSGFAQPATPSMAPTFTAFDIDWKSHSLSDYAGKVVVLEWFNPGCPYVKKHYESHNMQKLQNTYTSKDVIWLTVNSSAEGKQGYMTNEEAKEKVKSWEIKATSQLVDPEGVVGKAYNAKTTPHIFVIDKKGALVYQGAIDDNDSAKPSTIEGAKNYAAQALDEVLAGKAVSEPVTESYGCGVKYKS